VAHAVHVDDAELDALVEARAAVVACPWAYLRLAQGVTRGGRYGDLLARGGRLAVGCDSENAGDRIDVLGAAALLAGLVRDDAEDPTMMTAADALARATCDGAAAVGLGDVSGSLTVGRRADLVVLRPPVPAGDPYLVLVWGQGVRSVRHVVVDGRVVVRDGRVTTVDVDAATAAAVARRAGLAAEARLPDARPGCLDQPGRRGGAVA
jgi:5-methylthioadenosine/S-adenosylhomocysteine deaminase